MNLQDAIKKAKIEIEKMGLTIGRVMDDGKYFIIFYDEEIDISPMGVDKSSGEMISYFPPDHLPEYLNAVEIRID